jgi:hypothetical protein
MFQRQRDAQACNHQYNHPANNMVTGSVHWVAFAMARHWPILDDFTSFSNVMRPSI